MNIQAGTRGLSASDWIRLKRLRGSREFQNDKNGDVTNPPACFQPQTGRKIFAEFGISKIRRPASFWTDYRASQTTDYVLESQDSQTKSRSLSANTVCNGTKQTNCKVNTYAGADGSSVIKHVALCVSSIHS